MSRRPTHRAMRAFVAAPSGVAAAAGVAGLVTLAVIAPLIWGDAAKTLDVLGADRGPTGSHLLGTDSLGRDILARTLAATRLSIELAAIAVLIAATIGVTIGIAVATAGPRGRRLGSAIIDATLAFPDILIAVFVIAIVGVGSRGAVIAVAVAFAPFFARLANTLALSVAASDYVAAGRVIGAPRGRVLTRYILPNIADSLLIVGVGGFGEALIAISALSFLGLGVQPPESDWGRMLTDGVQAFYLTPAAALAPAAMLAITGLTFALAGDALARAINPLLWTETRTRRRGRTWRQLFLRRGNLVVRNRR